MYLPENAGTFRIVGVVCDAKFAGFGLSRPARPMFFAPLAQWIDYKNDLMKSVELRSHFIGGMMLVTNASPGLLEPLLTKTLPEVDPNLTITSVRTMEQQVALSFDQKRPVASLASLFGIVALLVQLILRGASSRVLFGLAQGVPLSLGGWTPHFG